MRVLLGSLGRLSEDEMPGTNRDAAIPTCVLLPDLTSILRNSRSAPQGLQRVAAAIAICKLRKKHELSCNEP